MKARAMIVAAAAVGTGVAFWLFGLAFTRSIAEFNRASLVPLAVAFVASLLFVVVQPTAAKHVFIAMSLPTLLWTAVVFTKLLEDGHGPEWGHTATALKVTGAALCGTLVGYFAQRNNRVSDA